MAGWYKRSFNKTGIRLLIPLLALLLSPLPAGAEHAVPQRVPGTPVLALGAYSLAAQGYTEREFFFAGTAVAYRAVRNAAGETVRPWKHRAYRTRLVVLAPRDPRRFNGTVAVEWLNVSTGHDIPIEWIMLHREMLRSGYAYVGVSAQKAGVAEESGLGRSSQALQAMNPKRYAGLALPRDAFSFDIFSDAGRLLRQQPAILLDGLSPRHLLAMGDSQSALYLTTYVKYIDPLARVYDGYLIHSRAGAAASLNWNTLYSASPEEMARPVRLPEYPRVPVLQLLTETDVNGLGGFIGFAAARQPDGPHLRSWEIPGAAHVDNYLLAGGMIDTPQLPPAVLAGIWAPMRNIGGTQLALPINNGPQHHYVAEAALAALNRWVIQGKAPAHAPAIALARESFSPLRDACGNAQGGIRTPWVDVPVSSLSGIGGLTGFAIPFDQARLARLYPGGRAQYLRLFAVALDRAITAGFILKADRTEILAVAALTDPLR